MFFPMFPILLTTVLFSNFIEVFANYHFSRNLSQISEFIFGHLHFFPFFFLKFLKRDKLQHLEKIRKTYIGVKGVFQLLNGMTSYTFPLFS